MAKRMVLLLLLILPIGLGGCYWHNGGREEYRPGDSRQGYSGHDGGREEYRRGDSHQGYSGSGYHQQGANTSGYEYSEHR